MSEKIESQDSKLDLVKWAIVIAIVVAGIYANSYFSAGSLLFRTIGLLIAAGVAGWIASQTVKGRSFVNLCLDARTEIRKVVWPTRQETTQTTIVVLIVIFIVAIILWLLDWGLNGAVSSIIG
ncbi:MAG: preprotein translocase subunit SecE [Gammaproteobacteria bacterium]|jgi:preprotein translocase subunit SecE|nr:preprotein translocase subunit SecE [Gammaproteobacteria bacterium]MBT4256908.1 preprotein translocase subunit SecE [Gammaproteobacteria bacterium]MBT4581171.1 preprotein translocase subunit SecE [Gammaproteobacteria bacterium]MBT4892318.1 preprotein translocase subunit SecE [Gammaproteobacteria bacterium]MBT5172705.1 preprotein translocase subunit SecE [Gammaproteobacteria bacterium]